jgi:hypothetical protein
MANYSADPEIRLRQKYESNRPFEDSLFVEVDKVSCGGVEGHAINARRGDGLPEGGNRAPSQETAEANPSLRSDTRYSRFVNIGKRGSEYQASPAGIKIQADGFHQDAESNGNTPQTFGCPQERGIGQPEQDICANKHKGAETSIAAHQRIAATSSELRQQIYSFALTSGERGITVKDVVERLKIVINTAAPRLSEMKRDGLLQIKGNERRDGCAVLIPRYAETSI